MRKLLIGMIALALSASPVRLRGEDAPAKPSKAAAPDRAELEKQFGDLLSHATMVGSYTLTGQGEDSANPKDKYTLGEVKKLKDDFWLFETRIQYGEHDVKLPITVEVKWAGDTPVITLTDMLIPGLGTFTARVVVYKDQYAGTWSGGDHGGHMYGTIVKEENAEKAEKPEKAGGE